MGERPITFEEAVERQKLLHVQADQGTLPGDLHSDKWRAGSLREGYAYRAVPEEGIGKFSVRPDGTVCPWQGKWSEDEEVLLCVECFLDGT